MVILKNFLHIYALLPTGDLKAEALGNPFTF